MAWPGDGMAWHGRSGMTLKFMEKLTGLKNRRPTSLTIVIDR